MVLKETLTRRERVMRAIEHKPVDRTPIDLGGHTSTGISAYAYQNLREYLGLPKKKTEVTECFLFPARVDEDILERFHCDCMYFHPGYPTTRTWKPRGHYEFEISGAVNPTLEADGSWVFSGKDGAGHMVCPPGGYFFDGAGFDTWASELDFNTEVAKYAEKIYKETDYFMMYRGGATAHFSDNPDYLITMMLEPEEIKRRCAEGHEWNLKSAADIIDKCGEYIQAISMSCDLGTQIAPFVNPALFADLIAPWLKKYIDFVKANSDYKIFFHTCGAMEPFISILIECGVDILNPVQVSCKNMEPFALKQKYGDKICFWGGGCDTHGALGTGTPKQVAENVRYLMSALAPGSGYVFNQVHNIMGNVKPANIVAMLDTAYEESLKYGNL
jgi:uroporphyrinogen decarboxylase